MALKCAYCGSLQSWHATSLAALGLALVVAVLANHDRKTNTSRPETKAVIPTMACNSFAEDQHNSCPPGATQNECTGPLPAAAASKPPGFCTGADWGLKDPHANVKCMSGTVGTDSASAPVQTELPVDDTAPDLEITVEPSDSGYDFKTLVLFSRENSLTIRDVIVNRGNCRPNQQPPLPQTLKFGERFKIGLFSREFMSPLGCLPIEVDAYTNRGRHIYSFGYGDNTVGVRVTSEHLHGNNFNRYLVFTGYSDNMTIRAVSVNRGNCHPYNRHPLPVTLKFGTILEYWWFDPRECSLVEVSISTDKGEHTFSMQH